MSKASTKYYKSVTFAKAVQQQQVFLQLIMIYTIVYLMCLPFLKIFQLNHFGMIYKICLLPKAACLDPSIRLIGFQQLLRAPLSNPFLRLGSSV